MAVSVLVVRGPSLRWDDYLVLKQEASFAERHSALPAKVFLSVCSEEGSFPALSGDAAANFLTGWSRLKRQLESRSYAGLELTTWLVPDETHTSGLPATYSRAFRALYGPLASGSDHEAPA